MDNEIEVNEKKYVLATSIGEMTMDYDDVSAWAIESEFFALNDIEIVIQDYVFVPDEDEFGKFGWWSIGASPIFDVMYSGAIIINVG